MDFRKRLKTKLILAICFIILGIGMIVTGFVTSTNNQYISSFGLGFVVSGVVILRQYFIITKTDESLKKQEIAETDERNVAIINKARSLAFTVYIIAGGLAVIVLSVLSLHNIAIWIALSVFSLVVFYWISYFIVRSRY